MAIMMRLKAQSAMEYLMTYGWAILIISVVLASLFSLGVFNAGTSLSTTCLALAGYSCSSPVLHGGWLYVTLGQSTGTSWSNTIFYYDPTGQTGCALPSTYLSGATLVNSVYNVLTFSSASNTIQFLGTNSVLGPSQTAGTSYSGTIWASYNTASLANLCVQLATINLKAT
jgi:hypothetical protein